MQEGTVYQLHWRLKRIKMRRSMNVFVVRQVFLEIAVCFKSFTVGISLAFPSVLNPAIQAPDSDIRVSPDQASWIATCIGLGGLVGYAFIPVVFEFFGRKTANIVTNLFLFIGSLIFYVASDVYSLAFARLTQGLSIGGTFMSVLGLCECISPKRRGYFMVLYKVSLGLGSLACHALGLFLNWRQIAAFGAIGNVISIICLSFIAESPAFFAMRGEFDKCAEAFEWFRGNSINAKTELKEFISAQMENLRLKEIDKEISVFKRTKNMLMSKEFMKSFSIVTLITLCLDTCGRYYLLAYITLILKELTKSTTTALYVSAASDIILIIALVFSIVLVKRFKRRTLLFGFGFSSAFLMFIISLSIVLRSKFNASHDLKWLTLAIILLQTLVTNIGLVPVAFTLTGELYTLEHRGLGSFMSGIAFLIFFNVILKVTPIMIEQTGVEGTYSIYGFLLFIFLLLLRIILPETKDKTLQQIEDEIKGVVRNTNESETVVLTRSKVNNG